MPAERTGKDDASSLSKHTKNTSIKDALKSQPKTAPLVPGTESKQLPRRKKVIHSTKKRVVRHVKVAHTKAAKAAVKVSRGYKKADQKALYAVKRALPERTLRQLAANRAANNGNLKFTVPISKKTQRKVPIIIPKGLRHIRHAALPGALGILLFFAFGFVGASPPGYGGTKIMGGSGVDRATHVATDPNNNVYTVGVFSGTVNFAADWNGTDNKTSSEASSDVFVTKTNANGSYAWTKRIPVATSASHKYRVATDSTGAVYVTGIFEGTVNFAADWNGTDEKTSAGSSDGFLTKINADGSYAWTKQFGDATADTIADVAVDGSDNLLLVGSFTGTVVFDADFGTTDFEKTSVGQDDIFVVKINNDGTFANVYRIGDTGSDRSSAIVATDAGDSYVLGACEDAVDFAADWSSTDEKNCNVGTVFITKVNNDDSYGWTKVIDTGNANVTPVAVLDNTDSLYIGGSFVDSSVDFAADWSSTDEKTKIGTRDGFLTKINANGNYGWTVTPSLDESGSVEVIGTAIDGDDVLYVVGGFSGTVDFANDFSGTDEKTSAGDSDVFLTKITTTEQLRKIGDAAGLTFKDSEGTNLSSTGTTDTNPTVYIYDQDNETLLATIAVDLSEDRDWSSLSGDSDTGEYKMFINGAIGAPGANTSMTLYVPKNEGDNAVVLCPGVESLLDVSKTCANKRTLTAHDTDVSTSEISGIDYWVIANVTDQKIGGMSVGFPGVSIVETDDRTEVAEGGAGDYIQVRLNAQPTDAVTVTITANPVHQLEAIDPIVFTTSNWDTPVNVYIEAVDDNNIEGAHTAHLKYSAASEDEYYNGTGEENVVEVHITDNDQAGVILHNTDNVIAEKDDSTEICVTLTARPTHSVTLNLETSDTSETSIPGDITIAPENWNNQVENCFTVESVDDDEVDGPKNSVISVDSIVSDDEHFAGLDVGTITPVTIITEDDDEAGFLVSAEQTITTEAGGSVQVCIKLTARPTSNVTIPVASSDTSEGSLGVVTNIVITPAAWNSNSNCVTVTGVDDDMVDGDIAYTLVTGDPTSADPVWDALDEDAVADQNLINEDDDEAGITISQTDGTTEVTEGGATDDFSIVLTSQPAPGKQVVVSIQPDTELDAGEGGGNAITKIFTDANWNTSQQVTVTAVNDNSVEGDHSGVISITVDEETTETPYLGLGEQHVIVAITDNDIATASIETISDATENPSSNGQFRVSLDHQNDTGSDMTFTYSVGGTAVADIHYAALSGSVTIPSGASSADIVVDVAGHNNTLLEGNKIVIVTLDGVDNPNAQISASNKAATVTIFDDEQATVSLSKTADGDENGPVHIEFIATLSTVNNTGTSITVDITPSGGTATSGSDYEVFSDQKISIPNGSTTGAITVTVIDDADFEPAFETLHATISNPSLSQVTVDDENSTAQAMITDNETAELSVAATTPTASENPSSNGVVAFTLDKVNNTGNNIQISYTVSGSATAGVDYDTLSGSVTIPNSQQSATVTIDTSGHDDDDMEGNETVTLTYDTNNLSERVFIGVNNAATVTIVDDETVGVTATATDNTTGEDGSTGRICFALASRPSADVTVTLASSDSSKVSVPSSITIERDNWNNANENCVTVTGHDDDPPAATGTEEVIIYTTGVVTDDPFYSELGGDDIADITIYHADNDTPGVIVHTVSNRTKEDGSKTAVVRFSLNTQPTDIVTIPLSVSDPSEGSIVVTEIAIDSENWSNPAANEVIIEGVDDYLTDGDITYQLVTGDPTSGDDAYNDLGANDVENPSLVNEDDDEADVIIAQTDDSTVVTEDGLTDTVYVSIGTQPAPGNQVVIRAAPADTQLDIGAGAGVAMDLVFTDANWDTPQAITVTALDDNLLEGSHNSQITYEIYTEGTTEEAYKNYAEALPVTLVAITDNDTAVANFSVESGSEAGPTPIKATVTLSKQNNTSEPITFTLKPNGGTATAGSDYADFSNTTVSISIGETSAEVVIGVVDDADLEGDETVELTLSNPSIDIVTIASPNLVAEIVDNDTAVATIVATKPSANENPSENGEFTVYLSKANNTGAPILITYTVGGTATAGSDYAALSGQVTIPHGSSSATIIVDTAGYDDATVENSETVIVSLQSTNHSLVSIGNPDTAVVTIIDDDGFVVSISKLNDGSEAGPVHIMFRVQLSQVNTTGSSYTVDISDTGNGTATVGSDYQAFGGTVTIPNGQQYADYIVEVIDDEDLENVAETVEAKLSNPSEGEIGVANATAIITDNETAQVTITATKPNANENPSEDGEFTISLDTENKGTDPILITYTVNGTATAGSDYAALSGTAMIAPNTSDTVVIINTAGYDDDEYEGDETVILSLSSANHPNVSIGSPSAATVTITDDDPKSQDPPIDNGNEDAGNENSNSGADSNTNNTSSENTPSIQPVRHTVVTVPVSSQLIEEAAQPETAPVTPQPQPVNQKSKDTDSDGIPDDEENKANNNGDGNGDGIPDSQQENVASVVSKITNKPVTLEARGGCSTIENFKIVSEDTLSKQDKRYKYPFGLVDYRLACEGAGQGGIVRIYYDQVYSNPGNWRKYSLASETFQALDFVKNMKQPVGKNKVTTVSYAIQDGGEQDDDGKVNGKISDPAGFAIRTFYILDAGWIVPVLMAAGFVGYAIWHRGKDYWKYRS